MRIVRRYHPDKDSMLRALLLVLSSTPPPAIESAPPGKRRAEGTPEADRAGTEVPNGPPQEGHGLTPGNRW